MSASRIAFLCPRFAEGATVGGAETLMRRLAERTAAAGRQVDFLTTCAKDHFTWRNEWPAGVRRFGAMDVHFFPVDENRDLASFLAVQDRISRGVRVSREEELTWHTHNVNSQALYEHLRTHGSRYDRIVMGPYLFALIYFASQIHPERTLLLPCLHDECFAYLQTVGDMFRSVRGFLFNAAPEGDLAVRLYGLKPDQVRVVGMGMDPFEADPQAFARRSGVSAPYVMYSGRRETLKGTPLLLEYLSVYRARTGTDVHLVLTGSGQVDPPESLRPFVHDLGFVSETEKHEAMAGAVAFCHPSVNESLSIVLLESWLAGTPVLVHAGSAVMKDHCVQSRGGLWFRRYPEFEEALSLLLKHPDLRRTLGKSGRRYVLDRYAWPAVETRLLAALDA